MYSIRGKYWRYSLYAILLGLGALIFIQLIPLMGGILGAITLYVLMRRQMRVLTVYHRMRRSLAAWLLLGETIVCFLVPLSLLMWVLATQLQHLSLDPASIMAPVQHFTDTISEKTGYNLLSEKNIESMVGMVTDVGQWLIGAVVGFVTDILVLLFVLYFMLVGGQKMERYLLDFIPFNRKDRRGMVHEMSMIVRSNAIGVPLLAIIQGVVAMIGYYIFGIPNAWLWGIVTCVASIIPIIGTAIVWLPLGIYLGVVGNWGLGIGLLAYGVIIITNSDNLPRLMLQKRMADTHPMVTIFGVIIGLSVFGFMGVIFGPVLLSIFLFCADLFKRRFLDECASAPPAKVYDVPSGQINTPEAGQ